MDVTALNAEWPVSNNFLPAERYCPSASNGWAASARCPGVRVLRVPSQVNETLTAAMLARRFWAGDGLLRTLLGSSSIAVALIMDLRGSVSGSGSLLGIQGPRTHKPGL